MGHEELSTCFTSEHILYLFAACDLLWNLSQSMFVYAAGVASGVIGLIITHLPRRVSDARN